MAFTAADLGQLATLMSASIKTVLEEVMQTRGGGNKVDYRALGGPPEWDEAYITHTHAQHFAEHSTNSVEA